MQKLLKFGILVAVVLAVLWLFSAVTGQQVMIGAAKKNCTLRRRRRVNGQLWQPGGGVQGPGNVLSPYYAPPIYPINPY